VKISQAKTLMRFPVPVYAWFRRSLPLSLPGKQAGGLRTASKTISAGPAIF
jgi:hypothetical protein